MTERIRILQEREEVSFEEAQFYLKKANGDIDRAIYLIHRRRNSLFFRGKEAIKEIFSSFWRYRIQVFREGRTLLNIPLFVFLLLVLLVESTGFVFTIFSLILITAIIVSGSELSIVKSEPKNGITRNRQPFQERDQTVYQTVEEGRPDSKDEVSEPSSQTQLKDYSEIIIK